MTSSDAAFAPHFFQAREQLVLAVKTPAGVVLEVIGILEFVRLNVLVRDPEMAHEILRIAFV